MIYISTRNMLIRAGYCALCALFVAFLSATSFGAEVEHPAHDIPGIQLSDLHSTYNDLLRLWEGPPDSGMWIRESGGDPIGLWQWGNASNALYSYWKITGSPDAAIRLGSVWRWIKHSYGVSALQACGSHIITVYGGNWALDDTGYNSLQFLEYYEVTHDPDALQAAKGSLDCGWARWQDGGTAGCTQRGTPAGGLWYDDACTVKSLVSNLLALDFYRYYSLSLDKAYRGRAVDLDAWVGNYLQRFPGSAGSNPKPGLDCSAHGACTSSCPYTVAGPYIDGLYWNGVNANGYTRGLDPTAGLGTPCQVAERGSATELALNMAEGVLLAWLYKDPLTPASDKAMYLRRIVVGSQGIKNFETGCGMGGRWCICDPNKHDVLLDDQDAFVNGNLAVMYAREVMPLIAEQPSVLTKANFTRTASVIRALDRDPMGNYGGSWAGPPGRDNCWFPGPIGPEIFAVTAQTINMIFAGFAIQ